MKQRRRNCGTCALWVRGDLTPKGIGNVGQCRALMPRTHGFYDKAPRVPFWAQKLSSQTLNFEGEQCDAHRFKRKK